MIMLEVELSRKRVQTFSSDVPLKSKEALHDGRDSSLLFVSDNLRTGVATMLLPSFKQRWTRYDLLKEREPSPAYKVSLTRSYLLVD